MRAVDTHAHIHLTREAGVPERDPSWNYDDPRAWNRSASAVMAEAQDANLVWVATVGTRRASLTDSPTTYKVAPL